MRHAIPAWIRIPAAMLLLVGALEYFIDWTTERPSLFETNWPGTCATDLEYAEGNIFQFMLTEGDVDRFGGIRVVSVTPRIIEVYLAVPNP